MFLLSENLQIKVFQSLIQRKIPERKSQSKRNQELRQRSRDFNQKIQRRED